VGRENRLRCFALDVAQDRLLDLDVLEDSLDHHVGVLDPAVVGGAGHQGHLLLPLAPGQPPPLDPLVEDAGNLLEAAPERRVVLVLEPHRDASVLRHVRDARAHPARPALLASSATACRTSASAIGRSTFGSPPLKSSLVRCGLSSPFASSSARRRATSIRIAFGTTSSTRPSLRAFDARTDLPVSSR